MTGAQRQTGKICTLYHAPEQTMHTTKIYAMLYTQACPSPLACTLTHATMFIHLMLCHACQSLVHEEQAETLQLGSHPAYHLA